MYIDQSSRVHLSLCGYMLILISYVCFSTSIHVLVTAETPLGQTETDIEVSQKLTGLSDL